MTLTVIGAGFPRTGTMSLKLALEELGIGRCHHMSEFYENPQEWPRWSQALANVEAADWEAVFKGYAAAVDVPACAYHRELARAFPEAKIILTTCDARRWFSSIQATVLSEQHQASIASSPVAKLVQQMTARLTQHLAEAGAGLGGAAALDPAALFEAYVAHVRQSIPEDRLLVYGVQEGWAPLCEFLERPIPETAFPHANRRQEFAETIRVPVPRTAS